VVKHNNKGWLMCFGTFRNGEGITKTKIVFGVANFHVMYWAEPFIAGSDNDSASKKLTGLLAQ